MEQPILYIALTASVIILTVLLSIALVYVIMILKDINLITQTSKDTALKFNRFVMQPVKLTKQLVQYAKPIISAMEGVATTKRKKKTTKSKN